MIYSERASLHNPAVWKHKTHLSSFCCCFSKPFFWGGGLCYLQLLHVSFHSIFDQNVFYPKMDNMAKHNPAVWKHKTHLSSGFCCFSKPFFWGGLCYLQLLHVSFHSIFDQNLFYPQNGEYGKTGVSMINLTTLILKIRHTILHRNRLVRRKKKSTFLMKIGIFKTSNYQIGLSRVNKTILYGFSTHFYIRKGFIKTHHQNLWWK